MSAMKKMVLEALISEVTRVQKSEIDQLTQELLSTKIEFSKALDRLAKANADLRLADGELARMLAANADLKLALKNLIDETSAKIKPKRKSKR